MAYFIVPKSLLYLAGFFFLFLPTFVAAKPSPDISIQLYANTQAYSPATPIMQWFDGFNKRPKIGNYAYENSRAGISAGYLGWQIGYEIRRYDYLAFNQSTLDFYYALEQQQRPPQNAKLDLDIKSFKARGLFLAKELNYQKNTLGLRLYYYQISDYQFGSLSGLTGEGDKVSATARVDYIFSEDKLLDYQTDAEVGYGLGLDINYRLELDKFSYELELKDFLSKITLHHAGFTAGCINVGQPAVPVCSSIGAGSGRSGEREYTTGIDFSAKTQLGYKPYKVDFGFFYHQDIRTFFAQKSWHYHNHAFQLGLKTQPSLLLGWHWRGLSLDAALNHYAISELNYLRLNLGYKISW